MAKKRVLGLAAAGVLLLAVILFLTVALGAQNETALPGVKLREGGEPILLADGPDGPLLVCEDGILALRGESITERTLSGPVGDAAFLNGSLWVLWDEDGLFTLTELTPGLDVGEEYVLFDMPADTGLTAVAYKGVYATEGHTLRLYTGDETAKRDFPDDITWMQTGPDGRLWLYAGGLYVGSQLEEITPVDGSEPQAVIGAYTYVDKNGDVWELDGDTAQLVVQGPVPGDLSWEVYGGLVWAQSGQRVQRLWWDGSSGGTCQVEGELLALSSSGAVYRQEGALYYAEFAFEEEPLPSLPESSETSQPEEPISSAPSEPPPSSDGPVSSGITEGPGWLPEERDGFLVVPLGAGYDELVEAEYPQTVKVTDIKGEPVTNGLLATGMQASVEGQLYTLVVLGDCTGDGKATGADVLKAQELLLAGTEEKAFFLAADLDGDGELTTEDLLSLSELART